MPLARSAQYMPNAVQNIFFNALPASSAASRPSSSGRWRSKVLRVSFTVFMAWLPRRHWRQAHHQEMPGSTAAEVVNDRR
jgi:hypothetical protein